MNTTRKTVTYYAVALAVVVGVVVLGGCLQRSEARPAHPDTRACVSRSEVRQLRAHRAHEGHGRGWTQVKVHAVTEAPGVLLDEQLVVAVGYPTCEVGDHAMVVAYFDVGRLVELGTRSTLGQPYDSGL